MEERYGFFLDAKLQEGLYAMDVNADGQPNDRFFEKLLNLCTAKLLKKDRILQSS